MILVDTALKAREAEGRPIRVACVGAGFMGQGLTNQIVNSVPGMRMVAAYSRRGQRAIDMFAYAGREDAVAATTQGQVEDAIAAGRPVVTEDIFLLTRSPQIDVLVDVLPGGILAEAGTKRKRAGREAPALESFELRLIRS